MGIVEPTEENIIKELEVIIQKRIDEGEDAENIISQLQQSGFDEAHIKEAFRRIGLLEAKSSSK